MQPALSVSESSRRPTPLHAHQDPPLPSGGVGKKGNTEAYTFCNGLLMAQFLILSYDVPGHMCASFAFFCFFSPTAFRPPTPTPSQAARCVCRNSKNHPAPPQHPPRAEETKRASFAVPRAILTAYFLGSALIFGFLLTFLYSITVMPNVRACISITPLSPLCKRQPFS